MSFDLAIWVGDKPADDRTARQAFDRLMSTMDETEPPDPRLLECKHEITGRYPEDWRAVGPGSIWATAPLDANGPLLYMNLRWDVSDEPLDYIVRTAAKHGLVCYDPQKSQVIEPSGLSACTSPTPPATTRSCGSCAGWAGGSEPATAIRPGEKRVEDRHDVVGRSEVRLVPGQLGGKQCQAPPRVAGEIAMASMQ